MNEALDQEKDRGRGFERGKEGRVVMNKAMDLEGRNSGSSWFKGQTTPYQITVCLVLDFA